MRKLNRLITALLFLAVNMFAGTVTDAALGYSIDLPEHWVKAVVDPTHHQFYDTTGTYQSVVSLVRSDFSAETVYTSATDWTRANFIAYKFSVEADPLSAVVFYDTLTVKQNSTLWVAELYSEFFSVDAAYGDYLEYIRFTASGTYGYELYALGGVEDMQLNAGFYAAIIEGIKLTATATTVRPLTRGSVVPQFAQGTLGSKNLDLLGRVFHPTTITRSVSGMRISQNRLTNSFR